MCHCPQSTLTSKNCYASRAPTTKRRHITFPPRPNIPTPPSKTTAADSAARDSTSRVGEAQRGLETSFGHAIPSRSRCEARDKQQKTKRRERRPRLRLSRRCQVRR
ncbi:MAG: hypothetical protein INR71_11620 [Terriglobus roseus]|nr:hypothetical protein [Terriglobus roseus]